MNIFAYAFMTYGLTALISVIVVGIIVLINKVMSPKNSNGEV